MIKTKIKYCENCKDDLPHTYVGKECRDWLLGWYNIGWECKKCGFIHIQNTAHLESNTN